MLYYCNQRPGAHTLDELKAIAMAFEMPIKFYDEQGFLRGTVYVNGEVQF